MVSEMVDHALTEKHIAGPEVLGFVFTYPPGYLSCIAWGDRDFDAGGDGHLLSFLTRAEVAKELDVFVRRATTARLVPFARGDNGDVLFCFDGDAGGEIYAIDLASGTPQVISTGFKDFAAFINGYRSRMGLPTWQVTR